MASSHASRQWLEALKFGVYVVTPIAATIYLGTGAYPYLEKIILDKSYIKYPAEGDAPPTSIQDVEQTVSHMRQRQIERATQLHQQDPKESEYSQQAKNSLSNSNQ